MLKTNHGSKEVDALTLMGMGLMLMILPWK